MPPFGRLQIQAANHFSGPPFCRLEKPSQKIVSIKLIRAIQIFGRSLGVQFGNRSIHFTAQMRQETIFRILSPIFGILIPKIGMSKKILLFVVSRRLKLSCRYQLLIMTNRTSFAGNPHHLIAGQKRKRLSFFSQSQLKVIEPFPNRLLAAANYMET